MDKAAQMLTPPVRGMHKQWLALHACHGTALLCFVAGLVLPTTEISYIASAMFVSITAALAFALGAHRDDLREERAQDEMTRKASRSAFNTHELFVLTDMLQAADTHADAGTVLSTTCRRVLPTFGGALYVFSNSRDRLDLISAWNESEAFIPAETLSPANCWALKRGKPHINDRSLDTLCCLHQIGSAATLEVPMMARGQVYGLLVIALDDANAFDRLRAETRLCRALADSISLTLANIALRESLRTQSLRDPLTGLYNRRYMEDSLERFISLAERSGSSTAAVMIDLDDFKRLNDEHGHAKGDAVLRDVASQLVGALRPSDVVSRYGGEELLIILPDCSLGDAMAKAETLRLRIQALSDVHGTKVTASMGVAAIPESASSVSDIIPRADAALYQAKRGGKNCVRAAEQRGARIEALVALSVN